MTMPSAKNSSPQKRRSAKNEASENAEDANVSNETESRGVRKLRIREALIKAGMEVFQEQGFDAATIATIADKAGISRRTFFRYFAAKDDLVFYWMDEQGDFMRKALHAHNATESPVMTMQRSFLALAEFHDEQPQRVRVLTHLIFDTPTLGRRYHDEQARWEGNFLRMLMRGRKMGAAESFALQVRLSCTITAFVVAIRSWATSRARSPLRDWVKQAFDAINEGHMS